jgi:cytochrome c556
MRFILLFLAGALIGTLVAFSAANMLGQRHAWPRGVMAVMQHHTAALRDARKRNACDAAATVPHWRLLAAVGSDIEPAYASTGSVEPDFKRQAQAFVTATAAFAAEPPRDCAALDQALPKLREMCEGCHRDYR